MASTDGTCLQDASTITPRGGSDSIDIARSAELVARGATIAWCTWCGRLVPAVNDDDECVLCVKRARERDYVRADQILEMIGDLLENAGSCVHEEDVIDLARRKCSVTAPRVSEIRSHENREQEERIAEVARHNAEVERLRALNGRAGR